MSRIRMGAGALRILFRCHQRWPSGSAGSAVDTGILPLQPPGQGTPYIINAGNLTGTKEVLLHKTDRILNWPLAFRIGFITDPERKPLLGTEVFKYLGFDDCPVSLTGNEHGILVDYQIVRAAAKPAEAAINSLAASMVLYLCPGHRRTGTGCSVEAGK